MYHLVCFRVQRSSTIASQASNTESLQHGGVWCGVVWCGVCGMSAVCVEWSGGGCHGFSTLPSPLSLPLLVCHMSQQI